MSGNPEEARTSKGEIALWALLAVVIAALLYFAAAERIARAREGELPVLKVLPEYRFENRDGRQIGSAELAGKPFIADFIFTHCPGVCPVLSRRMSELAGELPLDRINLVSFTVDPDNDNREALAAYAAKHQAPEPWYFLTGNKDELYGLIREGFQLMVDDSKRAEAAEAIVHSNRFVLVDADGRIRGYYNAFDADELAKLRQDVKRLLRR